MVRRIVFRVSGQRVADDCVWSRHRQLVCREPSPERQKKPRPWPGFFVAGEPSYIAGTKLGAMLRPFTCSSSAVRAVISVYRPAARVTLTQMLSLT